MDPDLVAEVTGRRKPTKSARDANLAERMALGLSIIDDPAEAAARVGIELPPAEIEALAAEAREVWGGLIRREPAALGAMIHSTLGLAALHFREGLPSMPPAQAAAAVKTLAQSLELIQGGTQPAYTSITINVPGKMTEAERIKIAARHQKTTA